VANLVDGTIEGGTRVKAVISTVYRHGLAANHTATHLLHYALRSTLGKDVTQAGSAVRADRFRFDFAYHEPVGPARLSEIEDIVNRKVVENHPVRAFVTSFDHAKDLGATALFGEKYGDFVRVVEIDDFSRELCGGTHLHATSEVGAFKIVSEASVGANVRRIEAITSRRALEYYRDRDRLLGRAAAALGSRDDQLLPAIEKLKDGLKLLESEIVELRSGKTGEVVDDIVTLAERVDGVNVVVTTAAVRDMDHLLALVDQVRERLAPAVVALGAESEGKSLLVVSASREATGIHAGNLVKSVSPILGGGGGGSPALGRAGGGDPAKLPAALIALNDAIGNALRSR
jgi:alanyl-tRNA synthetase